MNVATKNCRACSGAQGDSGIWIVHVRARLRYHFCFLRHSKMEVSVLRSVTRAVFGLAVTTAAAVSSGVFAQGAASPADLVKDAAVRAAIDGAKASEAQ